MFEVALVPVIILAALAIWGRVLDLREKKRRAAVDEATRFLKEGRAKRHADRLAGRWEGLYRVSWFERRDGLGYWVVQEWEDLTGTFYPDADAVERGRYKTHNSQQEAEAEAERRYQANIVKRQVVTP